MQSKENEPIEAWKEALNILEDISQKLNFEGDNGRQQ